MQTERTLAAVSGEAAALSPQRPDLTSRDAIALPPELRRKVVSWWRVCGQFAPADELLDLIEREDGESAWLLEERAALALARHDLTLVREAWRRRLAASAPPSARAAMARALLELGEIEEASAITDELRTNHGELATVRLLAGELALQQGDLGTAYDFWSAEQGKDETRLAPMLAMARIALLGGDADEARSKLGRATADPSTMTAAQLASAAGLAELLGQPARGQLLRQRFAQLEADRSAALAAEIDAALGRPSATGSADGRPHVDLIEFPTQVPALSTNDGQRSESSDIVDTLSEEAPEDSRVLVTLRDVFGHERLLPGQAGVINRVLAGRDTLAILPTGAGKSLTFQLSSLLLPGTTLVLSPLIALMKDQLDGLPPALREKSVLVNSSLSPDEQRHALQEIASGEMKLVYAAPERLRQPAFLRALRQGDISLVVVDEAHCISLWGHDFRPDYLSIPASLPELGDPPLLAMTATATPETAASLSTSFRRELDIVRTSSFRPNLYYSAEKLSAKEDKARRIIALCREMDGQGIVYVSSRRDAENLAGVLGDNGVSAVPYHAGLDQQRRAYCQDRFMSGAARVIVATVAFGMGVDKPDVRFIVHFSPSTSLEAYAQESGRAGRDGKDSRCILLYTAADRASQTRLANRDALDLPMLRQVYSGIKRHAIDSWAIFEPSRIVLTAGPTDDPDDLPDPRIGIGLLEQGGLLERHPNAPVTLALTPSEASADGFAFVDADDAAHWERFAAWAELSEKRNGPLTIRTAAACSALSIPPETLVRVLDERPDWAVREGDRMTCLKILPAGDNAAARLQRVLDAAAERAKARVNRIMTYAAGRRCRHVELAAHLGERLKACGDACDVCAGDQHETRAKPKRRSVPTAADEAVALKALATAPFPVGKTGLTRLLEGSIQSRIQGDRSPFFAALSDLQKSKIEATIDMLVDGGQLAYDRSREFPVLRVTPEGMQRLQREVE